MIRLSFFLCVLWLMMASPAFSQTGTIGGTILDESSGSALIGANILLVGTTYGSTTDLDGKFTISEIPTGTYDIRISLMGYNTKVITGITVQANETAHIKASLAAIESQAYTIEDIRVTAERVLSTSAAILADRKKAATIGDAISTEQISKSPDATSGDALKRVTGLSVVDNKYVYIRGVTDRYNSTTLNGISVTSTDVEVDRKSFSFDLIPASLISNTVVVKTATPDLQGDFSGGLVKVNTQDFPSERVINFTVAGARDERSTGEEFLTYWGGDRDWLGRDDGFRDLPENVPVVELPRHLPNNWATRTKNAPWNGQLNFAYGNRWQLGEDDLGLLGALSYNNRYLTEDFQERPTFQGVPLFDFAGINYENDILWGGMFNANYRRGTHKISWKNNFNQSGEDKVRISSGMGASADSTRRQTIEWNERTFLLSQLDGEHVIPRWNASELAWKIYYTESVAKQPDRKHAEFQKSAFSGDYFLRENYRTWSDLEEDGRGLSIDFSYYFNPKLKGSFSLGETTFKTGLLVSNRKRFYQIRAFITDTSNITDYTFYDRLGWSSGSIFIPENYGPGKLSFQSYGPFSGFYTGRHDLLAYYAMVDQPFGIGAARFRLTGGVRVEDSNQTVDSIDDQEPVRALVDERDPLPSANLTWLVTEDLNFRLAACKSVNRPEFREMAPVLYYDFNRTQNVIGNPDLQRAVINSYDARIEVFPSVAEVLAASVFYKDFTNAIEEQLIPSPERFVRTWFNSPNGENYGYELELRKDFGFLGDFFHSFVLTANYTRVESEIEYLDKYTLPNGTPVSEIATRPMQGQAPWMTNFSFMFNRPGWGTSFNILYNKIGRRLDAVGDTRDEDIYQEPRDLIDLAINQKLGRNASVKFAIKNLKGDAEIFTSGPERALHSRVTDTTSYSLKFSFDL